MFQVKIHLEKTSSLFKNLKKRGFLEDFDDTLFIWIKYKPAIGELIQITGSGHYSYEFRNYLNNRNKPIVLRITDLLYIHHNLNRNDNDGVNVLYLKCYEDSTINWWQRNP